MKKLTILLCSSCLVASGAFAMDLKNSKITQVVNDVQIISANQEEKPAAINDIFSIPDILRTGPASRAELVAPDETITRVGANTIFSFDPASRTIDLKQGSLLFHSPHGKGGGTIHTGSATASVLGSTLIVVTTPNGGFKVIALEDDVKIKFKNGLRQDLEPGRMTFILPGADQLAPIIIFRLDDLIQNSLLVKGFNTPLSSLPLIQTEIDKQSKLLHNGKAVDTGLNVGDNANADQVEVIDANTISTTENSAPLAVALAADATLNEPSLTAASIPTPPTHIFSGPFSLPGNSFFSGKSFSGFVAGNIFVNTLGLSPLTVDLSPYAAKIKFDLVAAQNFNIDGSVTFAGFANKLSLVAGNQFSIAPNSAVEADVADFELLTAQTLALNNVGVELVNNAGNLGLTSGADIDLGNATVQTAGNTTLTARGSINLNSDTFLNVANAVFKEPAVTLNSRHGSINISGTSIQAHVLTLNSGDGILLDGAGQTLTAIGAGATANLTAVNTLTVNNTDFRSFALLNLIGHTVNLLNDAFSGTVNIRSANGVWNNGTIVPGDVNNLGGNTYNGNPLTASEGFSGTIPGTQVTISRIN